MKHLPIVVLVLFLAACGVPGVAEQPTAAPVIVTQIVVVTATPVPATATPKSTATPKPSATPKPTAAPTERPTATPNPLGKWEVTNDKSSFDDSAKVVLQLDSGDDIGTESHPTLVIRCQEHKQDVYIVTDLRPAVESGALDSATARYRFDKEQAETELLDQSTSGKALFFTAPDAIIGKLLSHSQLAFQFTPFDANPVEMTFDLRGLPEAIKPLNEACK